jgi:hypothetical protein
MSTTTDRITDAFQAIADVYAAVEYADMCALGVWTDDPADPGVTAVVFQGKLYSLIIPTSYLALEPDTLSDVVNAVIVNAFVEWQSDRQRLIDAASNQRSAFAGAGE